jgi:ketosteroid isomerase-like protein
MDEPIRVIEKVYAAFADRDLDALLALCAPDVAVTQDPALPWGGQYQGPDGAATFVMKLMGASDSIVTPEQLFAAGDDVVQVGRTAGTVRSNGASFDIPEYHVWTVRDGLVVRAQFFIDSTAMLEAIGR